MEELMIRAIKDRILVKIVEVPAPEKGILIMPKEKKEYQIGQVVNFGYDIEDYCGSPEINEGDFVYTRKYAGLLIEYKGEEYISLDIKEILAVSSELG
jgi:chaperonin GroES